MTNDSTVDRRELLARRLLPRLQGTESVFRDIRELVEIVGREQIDSENVKCIRVERFENDKGDEGYRAYILAHCESSDLREKIIEGFLSGMGIKRVLVVITGDATAKCFQ